MKIENRKSRIGDFSSLLVVKPSSLGDIVHTLPAVHLIKQARPKLKITWLVNPEWAPLLAGNADLDRVLLFPRGEFRGVGGMLRLWNWLRGLERFTPDLALDFQGLARSAAMARFLGARRIHCLADAELLPRLLSSRVIPSKRDVHAVDRYLRLVADLGIPTNRPIEFPLPAGEKPAAFDLHGRYLLVHPFSRGKDKSLAPADLERLCAVLDPIQIVLVGRSDDRFVSPKNCVSLLNRTSIPELIWLIRRAHFTLSVDSGPMHIAAAITGRLLGIHTWTDPRIVGPYNPDAWVWKNGAIVRVESLDSAKLTGSKNFGAEDVAGVAQFLKAQF